MAGEFKDGLEHLPLSERLVQRATSVAELAAKVRGSAGVVPREQLQAVSEEYQSFREDIAAILGVSADPGQGDLVESVKELLWLHAEAVWEASEQSNVADDWCAAAERAEQDNNRLRLENKRLRREVEFEANGIDFDHNQKRTATLLRQVIADMQAEAAFHAPVGLADPNEISHEDLVAAQTLREYVDRLKRHSSLSSPQCSVHPDPQAQAEAAGLCCPNPKPRVAGDSGERHGLDEVIAWMCGVRPDDTPGVVSEDGNQ
jgi:hypothetical protein